MKKYQQVIFILGAFFIIVLINNKFNKNKNISSPSDVSQNQIPQVKKTENTAAKFKDGSYLGSVEDAFYGDIQVEAVISNGKLTDVVPIKFPNDNPTSTAINTQALAILKSEAIQNQGSKVDIVTGASDSSPAFSRSLKTALSKAL